MRATVKAAVFLNLFLGYVYADNTPRMWTDLKGNKISASFVGFRGDTIDLRSENGKQLSLNRDSLSDEDWLFVTLQNPEFLNCAVEIGVVSGAQRLRVSEKGKTAPSIKREPVRFSIDQKMMLKIENGKEQWIVPYKEDFWEIATKLVPFKSGEFSVASGSMWSTESIFFAIESKNCAMLRINLQSKNETSWWQGIEGKQVVTILFDERCFNDLRAMPDRTAKAIKQLQSNPRIQRVNALLDKWIEKNRNTLSLDNVIKSHDVMEAATFYKSKRDVSQNLGDITSVAIYPYIAKTEAELRLKFKVIYTAKDWLFIKKVTLVSESGQRVVIDLSEKYDSKVVSGAGIAEWSDVVVLPSVLLPFKNATQINCRLDGQLRKDFVLSADQLMAMREILTMFLKLRDGDGAAK